MSQFNAKFFYLEDKFTLAEVDLTRKYLGPELDVFRRSFMKKPWTALIQWKKRCLSTTVSTA